MQPETRKPESSLLRDSFGRVVNNLRISVTDRCNFRCRYCMPEEGMVWLNKDELLTYEEIARVTRIFAELGVNKIRLTGGEPLMRKDLYLLVEKIARIERIKDLALTTNGFFLAEQAVNLFKAGLRRINISLDSLDAAKFQVMTRRDYYGKVWQGIETVESLGIRPIKLNVVLIRGINDDEIPNFARLARTKSYAVRFIEFMPIGSDDGWTIEKVVPSDEIIRIMEQQVGKKLVPIEYHGSQPADRYRFEDGLGEIGFISSVSEPFCEHCNRVRITSDGKLRTCLFSLGETDLKSLLRGEASDGEIKEHIVSAVWKKEEGHLINRPGFVRPSRTMSQIGG
ncbi:MAG TPA: GTP 3',8-cyclase MoaA [Bacteroidota bacterium]|nr:GTP 3',8-cyclase MoaA [Bacteroidota bacterium]